MTDNSGMFLLILYCHLSLYNSSILDYSESENTSKGGDYLTADLLLMLTHYASILLFYLFNIGDIAHYKHNKLYIPVIIFNFIYLILVI